MNTISLSQGERLLWSGAPRQGIVFRPADFLLVPFSLLWGGFAVYWELSVIQGGAPFFFAMWGIPFICIGLYFVVGRFFWDSYRRAHTNYAVTQDRILIQTDGLRASLVSLGLTTLPVLELEQRPDGSGTLVFGSPGLQPAWMARSAWPGAHRPPMFDMIPDAKSVFDVIQKARQSPGARDVVISR